MPQKIRITKNRNLCFTIFYFLSECQNRIKKSFFVQR